MKKIKIYLFALVIFTAIFVTFAPASYASTQTRVRGNIYDVSSGHGIAGNTVSVNCNGTIKYTVTDGNGLYVVDYTNQECGKYTSVTSTVAYQGQTQSQTVYVSHQYTATLDFYFGTVGVPEFGLLTGIGTTLASAGAYFMLKKKLT